MTILPALFPQGHDDTENDCHDEFLTNGDVNNHSHALTPKTADNGVNQTNSVFNRIPRPKTTASVGKTTLVGSLQQLDRRPSNTEELRNASSRRNLQPRPATSQVTHRGRNDVTKKSTNMSMGELPPIGKRPGSGTTSKLSSRGSSKELLKGSVIKYERRNLISVDNLSNDNGRFSKRSLGSEESSAWSKDRDSSSNINSTTDDKPGSQRGSQSNSISQGPNKLSTLFETNGTSPTGPSTPVPHDENHFPSPRNLQTRVRASSNERRLAPSKRTASMKSLVSDRSLQSKSTAGLSDRRLSTNRRNSEFDFNGSMSGKATSRSILGRRTPSMPSLSQNAMNGDTSITQSQSQKPGVSAYRNSQSKTLNNDNETQLRPKTNNRSHQRKSKPSDIKDTDDGDTDAEKEKRIWDWLASIVGAERPPSPIIIEDEPAQTDTAIHIVYDGEEQ